MVKLAIEAIQYSRKRTSALIFAALLYLLLALLLLVEFQMHQPIEDAPQILPSQQTIHAQQEKGPAPVRFVTPPNKPASSPSTATAQPPAQQPVQSQTITPTKQPEVLEKPLEKQPEKIEEKKKVPEEQDRKIIEKPPKSKTEEIPRTQPQPPKPRSKNKWFKTGATPPQQQNNQQISQQPTQNSKQLFASQLNQGFSNFVTQRKKIEAAYSVNQVHGNQAESAEYEMFTGKLVHAVCKASHANPLTPRSPLIKEHDVVVQVTCDRNRKISDIKFIQPSYDAQVNDYFVELVKTISPPMLPSSHKADKITFPLKIHMHRQYYSRNLTMVPA